MAEAMSTHQKLFMKLRRAFNKGETLFHEGDGWDGVYVIQKGLVLIHKRSRTETGLVEVELARLGPGELLGEMGIFEPGKREASARALENTEILVMTREMFQSQLETLQPWVRNIIGLLVQRLRDTNVKYLDALNFKNDSDRQPQNGKQKVSSAAISEEDKPGSGAESSQSRIPL
jgi:CRP/FNR family transcriptional regulator